MSSFSLSCVVLTMGTRPAELERAIDSALNQTGEPIDVLLIGNGTPIDSPRSNVRTMALPENVGIPAGRNVGIEHTESDAILFLDDDGWYCDNSVADHVRSRFALEPDLAVISFRILDPDTLATEQRHVPRLGKSDPLIASDVTAFLGGACAIRSSAVKNVGGFPGDFFYGHEESDLAWRLMDAGWRIAYDSDCSMFHPAASPSRHADYLRLNARNRAWLVKRNLPLVLAVIHLAVWTVITMARLGLGSSFKQWFAGLREGLRTDAGPRRPMKWKTVWAMTALRRPPII